MGRVDLRGLGQLTLCRPNQEDFQGIAAALQRALGVVTGRQLIEGAALQVGDGGDAFG
jgi:hypothetical protein